MSIMCSITFTGQPNHSDGKVDGKGEKCATKGREQEGNPTNKGAEKE